MGDGCEPIEWIFESEVLDGDDVVKEDDGLEDGIEGEIEGGIEDGMDDG